MRIARLVLFSMLAFVGSAVASMPPVAEDVPPDTGFAPALLFMVLFLLVVLLVLVGIGVVIGTAFLACTALFVALGVLSSSAYVALLCRRFSAGLRALHYQLLALLGVPCGIGALWFGCWLFPILQIRDRYKLIIGSVIGMVAGVLLAFVLDWLFRFVYRRLMPRGGMGVSR